MWRIACIKQIFWANQTIVHPTCGTVSKNIMNERISCVCMERNSPQHQNYACKVFKFQAITTKKKNYQEIVSCFGAVNGTFVPITCIPPIRPMARFSKIRCKQFITLHCSTLLKITNNTTTDEWRHYKIHRHTHIIDSYIIDIHNP